MEDTTSTEETAQGTPVYYRWSFHEVIRAILRCLGLETEFQQNPSCPKKEDDGKVNNNQSGGQEEGADPPSTIDYSDPPSKVTDPAADPPSTTVRLLTSLLCISYIYIYRYI